MNELPELVVKKIWKYRLDYVFQDVNNCNHKLLVKFIDLYKPRLNNLRVFSRFYDI